MKKAINFDVVFALIAITFGVLTRTIFDLGVNIEMVTAFGIVSGYFIKNKKLAFVVPLLTMAISDTFIKNTSIFIFTWSGFLIGPMLGMYLKKVVSKLNFNNFTGGLVGSQIAGIVSTLFFFVWTNGAVWATGTMYSKDFAGLIQSYVMGLPFLNNQLSGNLIIVPLVFLFGYVFFNYQKLFNPIEDKTIVA